MANNNTRRLPRQPPLRPLHRLQPQLRFHLSRTPTKPRTVLNKPVVMIKPSTRRKVAPKAALNTRRPKALLQPLPQRLRLNLLQYLLQHPLQHQPPPLHLHPLLMRVVAKVVEALATLVVVVAAAVVLMTTTTKSKLHRLQPLQHRCLHLRQLTATVGTKRLQPLLQHRLQPQRLHQHQPLLQRPQHQLQVGMAVKHPHRLRRLLLQRHQRQQHPPKRVTDIDGNDKSSMCDEGISRKPGPQRPRSLIPNAITKSSGRSY